MAEQDIPEIHLAYAFSIRFETSGRIAFEGPISDRAFESVSGGEVWGPRLQGRVVPQSGADYATRGQINTTLMLQVDDGTPVFMNQLGYEYETAEDSYFRVTPYFETPHGPSEWLSKTVFLGTGERHSNPAHIIIHYYEVL